MGVDFRTEVVNIRKAQQVVSGAAQPMEVGALDGKGKFAKGKGCPYCQKKGYRGRIGIYELMLINGRIRDMMFTAKSSAELRSESIRAGMTTLYCDGLRKVVNGTTTLDEVYRSAKKTEQEHIAIARVVKEILDGSAPLPAPT